MSETGKRRSDRILGPGPIRVIGDDASGSSFEVDTVTVSFNQHGACVSLIHSLLRECVVVIKNRRNGIEAKFRVVGELQQVFGNRREWGVEAIHPESDIWGAEFIAPPNGLQPKVPLQCLACTKAVLAPVSSI